MRYNEVHQPSSKITPPEFPEVCPACGAPVRDQSGEDAPVYEAFVIYECEGEYEFRHQIQSHTDKWWGYCPKR